MMFWNGSDMGAWGYTLMTISTVLFWALLIVGVITLVRYLGRASEPPPRPENSRWTPEQLLAERFARGEIDEQEYRQRLATLHTATRHLTSS